jgi:hypothetical protein
MITLVGITGSNTTTSYADPPIAIPRVGFNPIPGYFRYMTVSPNGVVFTNGTNAVAIDSANLWLFAANTGDVGLSYVPYITVQPASHSAANNAATAFNVTVTSELSPSYQWQYSNGVNISAAGVYANVTTNNMNISNVNGLNAVAYKVLITNAKGNTTSNTATLTVT